MYRCDHDFFVKMWNFWESDLTSATAACRKCRQVLVLRPDKPRATVGEEQLAPEQQSLETAFPQFGS